MAAELVKLKRGTKATMPTAKEAGTILIATDTGEAYVDNSSTERVQLKDSTKLPLSGGTMTGPIDMGTNKITSSAAPSSGSDVTNKTYLDEQVQNAIESTLNSIEVETDTNDAIDVAASATSTKTTITINHTINLSEGDAGHKYGPASATSVGFGGSFNVPNITLDDYGHTTKIGHVAITLPNAPTVSITAGNEGITASGTVVSHVTHTALSGGPTENSSPNHGESFMVPQIESDGFGHVTSVTNRTITLPSAPGSVGTLSTPRSIDGVKFDGSADIIHYGTCGTLPTIAVKSVDLPGFVLTTGARVYVKFYSTNTAENPKLNVNSTGAKSIYYRGSLLSGDYLVINRVYEFIYNGANYDFVGDIDTVYTAGAGLTINDTAISLESTGVVSGTYGPSEDVSGTDNCTINVPQLSVDDMGRITSIENKVLTNKDTNTTYTAGTGLSLSGTTFSHASQGTSQTVGPGSSDTMDFGDNIVVPQVTTNSLGHVTKMVSRILALPEPKITTDVATNTVQFRNIVIVSKGTTPSSVTCPVGTIICVKEE